MRVKRSSKTALRPKDSALLFAALGDRTRLRLLSRLSSDGPMSIAKLTSGSAVSRQAITKHLRVMRDAGLLSCVRHGRESVWRLQQRRLKDARRYLGSIARQWDDALDRLRTFVETGPENPGDH